MPSQKILVAIRNFVVPENITDAWLMSGLVNQVVVAYSIGPIMEPFHEIIKVNNIIHLDATLNQLFEDSEEILIQKVSEGIIFIWSKTLHVTPTRPFKRGIGIFTTLKILLMFSRQDSSLLSRGLATRFSGSRCTQGAEEDYPNLRWNIRCCLEPWTRQILSPLVLQLNCGYRLSNTHLDPEW